MIPAGDVVENKIAFMTGEIDEPILSPIQAARWTKKSKNTIYALLKSGELRSFVMRGAHLISKLDLIDYLLLHADDTDGKRFRVGGGKNDG